MVPCAVLLPLGPCIFWELVVRASPEVGRYKTCTNSHSSTHFAFSAILLRSAFSAFRRYKHCVARVSISSSSTRLLRRHLEFPAVRSTCTAGQDGRTVLFAWEDFGPRVIQCRHPRCLPFFLRYCFICVQASGLRPFFTALTYVTLAPHCNHFTGGIYSAHSL